MSERFYETSILRCRESYHKTGTAIILNELVVLICALLFRLLIGDPNCDECYVIVRPVIELHNKPFAGAQITVQNRLNLNFGGVYFADRFLVRPNARQDDDIYGVVVCRFSNCWGMIQNTFVVLVGLCSARKDHDNGDHSEHDNRVASIFSLHRPPPTSDKFPMSSVAMK